MLRNRRPAAAKRGPKQKKRLSIGERGGEGGNFPVRGEKSRKSRGQQHPKPSGGRSWWRAKRLGGNISSEAGKKFNLAYRHKSEDSSESSTRKWQATEKMKDRIRLT